MTAPAERRLSRRDFVGTAGSCLAHLSLMSSAASPFVRGAWAGVATGAAPAGSVVAEEPWGRLERIAEGVWAMVSTPLTGDRTTLCNGGLVAGRNGVLMVEAFASDAGAKWMASQAVALTGRAPTHVLLTHYHSDHSGGVRGAIDGGGAKLRLTDATRALVTERNAGAPADLLRDAELVNAGATTSLDLGGRTVTLRPLDGHTPSDVAVRVEEASVVFCGDLVWNGMFPNYVDAVPSRLTSSVKALRDLRGATYVPGHGSVATPAGLDRYLALLESVEAAARRAVERGITAEAAGAEYRIPGPLGEWVLFNPRYFERAIGAWLKELAAPR
ncbi:MAG: MBL fold metallo-hydrolase [Gemmatimonadetes bacterium]|nr:MBL fold metallo-hydrolase [Gemmatimonadota bacterium]